MLTYLLDTGCLIAAQTPGERYHSAAAQLVDAGEAGRVNLITATSVEYDLEAAGIERAQDRREWLSDRSFIRRVPGPVLFDISRLDWGDVIVSDEDAELITKLGRVVGTPAPSGTPGDDWRRDQIDFHHAAAAVLAKADALVSTDLHDLIRKRDAIWSACGLCVLDPEMALAQLDGLS